MVAHKAMRNTLRLAPTLDVYDTFETAEESGEPADILATAANARGADYVRKLDI